MPIKAAEEDEAAGAPMPGKAAETTAGAPLPSTGGGGDSQLRVDIGAAGGRGILGQNGYGSPSCVFRAVSPRGLNQTRPKNGTHKR